MSKNVWDCTLEILRIVTEIDSTNEELYKTDNVNRRRVLSDKIDVLESNFFELKNKLKEIEII